MIKRAEKSPAAVWAEMEAFELLMEIEDFNAAADLLVGATELLNRWGFVHYLDSQHRRLLHVLGPERAWAILHDFGNLLQLRGDYEQALEYYERSLKISEELGNRVVTANTYGQIGSLLTKTNLYAEAFDHLLHAFSILLKLQSPNVNIAMRDLKRLRIGWGEQSFDAAWKTATETEVVDWLKVQEDASNE